MKGMNEKFLYALLQARGPSGYEEAVQKIVRNYVKDFAKTVETDLHGNLIVGINTKAKRRVMLAGHADQIGFLIKHIDKNGYLFVDRLGGIDAGVLPGSRVEITGKKGIVTGVFGRKPIHKQKQSERENMNLDIARMWIDIGAKDQKAAEKLVEIGAPATFATGVLKLGDDLVSSPALDNRVGVFIAMEVLRHCTKEKLDVAVYGVSTVQEEVGLRGAKTAAFAIDPEVGIAIDVTTSTDNPGADESAKESPCALGKGAGIYSGPNVNPIVHRMLTDVAKKSKIPHQPLASSNLLGNDANIMQVSRGGMAAGSIGVPNRYMHTQAEVCSLSDIHSCIRLLVAFLKTLKATTDLRPR